ncbi:lipopolysaccharide biosynthesis protein [Deinococcus frigens]|uniref:lipopolysaccharide biosynthesis protein n=1 Tax=Deinococcus frigens TaxID=249403 RepID=UPI0004950BDE|nr:oligosaccharide flippase family protein [Deinococcus frigens]
MNTTDSNPRLRPARDRLIINAMSLVGTSAITSGLGFVFWWTAARLLPAELVGAGSAVVSAMLLISTLAMLGLGTLLISELPSRPTEAAGLMSAALITCGVVSMLAAGAFALVLPHLAPAFTWVSASPGHFVLFASGIVFTTITLVFDQAIIGLLRGDLQLWRNGLSATVKIIALLLIGLVSVFPTDQAVYFAWLAGNVASMVAVGWLAWASRLHLLARPDWPGMSKLFNRGLRHHGLNLAMQAPGLALPVLVAGQLSSGSYARFYIAWMVAGFVGMVPYALATVLPAVDAGNASALHTRFRSSLTWAFMACSFGIVILVLVAPVLLGMFGPTYRLEATDSLRILALTSIPVIVKAHYIALGRIQGRLNHVAVVVLIGGVTELCAAALGGHLGGLTGLSIGLLLAYTAEALYMLPKVLHGAGWSP